MAERARTLWLYDLPGLTGQIINEGARALHLIVHVKELDVTLSQKLGEIPEPQWLALRAACAARCGIPDYEAWAEQRILASPGYQKWREDLSRYQERCVPRVR